MDVGFVLDGSASVGKTDWGMTLEYVKEFADSVTFNEAYTQIGVVTFGNAAWLKIPLGSHGNDCDAFKVNVHLKQQYDDSLIAFDHLLHVMIHTLHHLFYTLG